MSNLKDKIMIVPCSGIGKPYGTVSRVTAYQVTEDDRPDQTQLVPLALLVIGDEEYGRMIADYPAITIDGCTLACATKMVKLKGGQVAREFAVLEAFRRHRDLKPQGIAELNEDGERLAAALAKEVVAEIDALTSRRGDEHD